ncbi:MAG: hypothetical protein LBJ67_09920 [Planctomycetaceae bacterium]|jgi:hypothetical protein|nr:hypothetical protein [Planctomycetaceae bacterium]
MLLGKITLKHYCWAFAIVVWLVSSSVLAEFSVPPTETPQRSTPSAIGDQQPTTPPAQPDTENSDGERRDWGRGNLQKNAPARENPIATRSPNGNSWSGNPAAIHPLQNAASTQPTLPPSQSNPMNPTGALTSSATPHSAAVASSQEKKSEIQYFIAVNDESHPIYSLVRLERPRDSFIVGKKTYLYEILSGVPSSRRQELAEAYWKLSEKLLLCHARMGQKHRITAAKQYYQNNPVAYKELELAEQLTDRQYKALELEFIQSQYQFVSLQKKYAVDKYADTPTPTVSATVNDYRSERPTGDTAESQPLPIPAEFPLAVPYNTKIKELEKYRSLSQNTLLLDRTIPLQYQSIIVHADARKCAENKMLDDLNAQRSIVASIETLTNEEIELIKAVIEYNHQVDNYVIETYGVNISSRQFLASVLQLPKRPAAQTTTQPTTTPTTLTTAPFVSREEQNF